ncbi:single-stranded DNA-binding protein [Bacillus sp. JJ1503]|uniref:single-stranded DNA-binding protein n=1 Tax=Bacillus sp. JJ1503 TaxID=3122956 RepID=UPI002FFD7563
MSIRDILKQREQARDQASKGDSEFPEGVTRYVRMGRHGEVNADGKTFVILAQPDDWYVYFVHEDKVFEGKTVHKFRKHTCLHSPKEANADLLTYFKPGKSECISCKAGAKRKMFFMIPVFDPEYNTYRVIDVAEFHANNLIADYDKAEKPAKKFNKDYSLVGDAVFIKQSDKTYALESAELDDAVIEAAKAFIGFDFGYADLANFREEADIITLLQEATDGSVDKSVLGGEQQQAGDASGQQYDF